MLIVMSVLKKDIFNNTSEKNNQEKALDILKSLDSILRMVYFFNEEKKVISR